MVVVNRLFPPPWLHAGTARVRRADVPTTSPAAYEYLWLFEHLNARLLVRKRDNRDARQRLQKASSTGRNGEVGPISDKRRQGDTPSALSAPFATRSLRQFLPLPPHHQPTLQSHCASQEGAH
jgi:hypothetical protein